MSIVCEIQKPQKLEFCAPTIKDEQITPRHERALQILEQENAVKQVKDGIYTVKAQGGYGLYRVEDTGEWKCNCPDYIKHGGQCKHILATRYYLEVQHETPDGIHSEKVPITYKQAWSAYNSAQTQEIEIFDNMLAELVQTVAEPEQTRGRPRLPITDQLFCSIQKVYSQLSSRRASGLFGKAEDREQVSHAPHFNATSKTLNKKDITPILHELVRLSASPLAGIEKDFATDSSGFRTTRFSAYCGEKHGNKKHNVWLKAHISSGVHTNIVADVVITDSSGADPTQFESLVIGTNGYFTINEMSADKAYSSRHNHDVCSSLGIDVYIPFKKNATGKVKGSVAWKKAFHYFQLNQDEFYEHYHKRSNAESTFGAIKQKFGETLKSKNTTAQVNELLCKIIAYNITVLIHEMFEHGITPDFLHLKSTACT